MGSCRDLQLGVPSDVPMLAMRLERSLLFSVLTESEELEGICPMAIGLIRRIVFKTYLEYCSFYFHYSYDKAGQDPPQLLYTTRDCHSVTGTSKCVQLFAEWDHLQVGRNHCFVSIHHSNN